MLLFSPYVLSLCDSMGYSVPVFPGLHYLLKFMSINSVMLFNHLILCHHLLILPSVFPSIWSFLMSWLFVSSSQNIAASPLASILPMNIQGKFPIGLTCLISLLSKGLSKSSPVPQFKSINSSTLSLLYVPTLTSLHDYWRS